MTARFTTEAERQAYNAGVLAVLKIAHDAAEAIARTNKRPLHEGFAIAALAELVEGGKALLLPLPGSSPLAAPVLPPAPKPAPAAAMAGEMR